MLFQFLIVQLKDFLGVVVREVVGMFQFLIVQLKDAPILRATFVKVFQFLIVQLKEI